jgi:ComF family protein
MGAIAALALEAMLALLAPPRCAACDGRVRMLAVFCPSCARSATRAPDEPSGARVALVYGGAVARAIARMKYEARPDLARPLGDLLWRAVEPHAGLLREAVVVPVPLHPTRLAERGFNQSALMARRVAVHLGARFEPRMLARTRETQQQAALDRTARRMNVADAFEVRDAGAGALVRRGIVLLVDDVITTGATLDACERALLGAGATHIHRAVLAAAPRRVDDPA